MGTRSLIAVRQDKEIKVAQYSQWDGYPTGQGETISTFLRNADIDRFGACVKALKWYTNKQVEAIWDKTKAAPEWSLGDSSAIKNKYPALTRDTGADILQLIHDGKIAKVENSWEFIKDTLFCEYAYVLDLDNEVVEVYADNYKATSVEDYKPDENVSSPVKVIPFAEFAEEGAMEKLEEELNAEDQEDE